MAICAEGGGCAERSTTLTSFAARASALPLSSSTFVAAALREVTGDNEMTGTDDADGRTKEEDVGGEDGGGGGGGVGGGGYVLVTKEKDVGSMAGGSSSRGGGAG